MIVNFFNLKMILFLVFHTFYCTQKASLISLAKSFDCHFFYKWVDMSTLSSSSLSGRVGNKKASSSNSNIEQFETSNVIVELSVLVHIWLSISTASM
eukprot:m.40840 g.40840  ORF g.40840 m.40840 type:complete len:97 (+) comp10382_c2_seq1:31-321(+)